MKKAKSLLKEDSQVWRRDLLGEEGSNVVSGNKQLIKSHSGEKIIPDHRENSTQRKSSAPQSPWGRVLVDRPLWSNSRGVLLEFKGVGRD